MNGARSGGAGRGVAGLASLLNAVFTFRCRVLRPELPRGKRPPRPAGLPPSRRLLRAARRPGGTAAAAA